MPITTRQKILDYLKRNRKASSREIALVLNMTPANARYHLGILAADGRVEVVSQQQLGRGRPEKVYKISEVLAGNNLSMLLDALLTEAGQTVAMDAVGKRLAVDKGSQSQPLMRRLDSTIKRLNIMHYQARWEAGSEGPRITLGHCPYMAIIEEHPQLCQMDSALLDTMLGVEVEHVAKLKKGVGDMVYCRFLIR